MKDYPWWRTKQLVLIPTPIDDGLPLEEEAKSLLIKVANELQSNNPPLILVEEPKAARRRWLSFGLPREAIEQFIFYNEHNQKETVTEIVKKCQQGQSVYLMSDCGLPAFCDPGKYLVRAFREANLPVTSTPFPSSVTLALALSGFDHEQFTFLGFLPRQEEDRKKAITNMLMSKETAILMDTPYRLDSLLQTIKEGENFNKKHLKYCLCIELNRKSEEIFVGNLDEITAKGPFGKRDFILIAARQ